MEAWLSELEKAWNSEEQNNDPEEKMNTLAEELDHILGEEFPSIFMGNSSPKINKNSENPTKISGCSSTTQISPLICNISPKSPTKIGQKYKKSSENNENDKKKRKREPSQTYDHIMAERKRREFLTQKFIALSAIIPGLKKVDKTTILIGAINYLQQLQQRVKALEEEVASKQNEETMMVIRRSQLVVDNDDDDSACTDDESSAFGGGGGGGCSYKDNSLPHVEVKVANKSLLLTIHCKNQKGISSKIMGELENHEINVLNTNTIPFGNSAFNITIVAQTEKTEKKHVKKLVKAVLSILHDH
ncbi:hypothetical protein RND81_05G206300 [Saponaria officinalis]|uniref:Uncharacterized protein n=1 Tax=Saponaria officinalis TaxID=3572 RepID=A0AAW1L0G0_SAPOF